MKMKINLIPPCICARPCHLEQSQDIDVTILVKTFLALYFFQMNVERHLAVKIMIPSASVCVQQLTNLLVSSSDCHLDLLLNKNINI